MPIIIHGSKWDISEYHPQPIPNQYCEECGNGQLYFIKLTKSKTVYGVSTYTQDHQYGMTCSNGRCDAIFTLKAEGVQIARQLQFISGSPKRGSSTSSTKGSSNNSTKVYDSRGKEYDDDISFSEVLGFTIFGSLIIFAIGTLLGNFGRYLAASIMLLAQAGFMTDFPYQKTIRVSGAIIFSILEALFYLFYLPSSVMATIFSVATIVITLYIAISEAPVGKLRKTKPTVASSTTSTAPSITSNPTPVGMYQQQSTSSNMLNSSTSGKTCPDCGFNQVDSLFCPNCGSKV